MKVLHIEDRRENRLLVRKLLESRGFTVTDAVDGLTGIELAFETRPDLILVDINIPGLDGYAVVTKLKGDPRLADIPVVAITAEGDRRRALSLGFDGFLTKPIQMATFVDELRQFLEGKRETVSDAERTTQLVEENRRVVDHLEAKVRELTRANDRLREVDHLKMEVLRNVSHELSTPMTPLLGYVKMLAGAELGPVTDAQRGVLTRMDGSLHRLKGLIDNLLNVTRFATGAVSLQRAVVDPARVVEQAVAATREAAAARPCTLDVALGTLEPIIADAGRLTDALRQVIDNAIRFGPEGQTVRVEARLVVEGDGDRRGLELIVDDAGPGIAPELRDRVCQPFYQVDGSVTRQVGGAGLGLAIAERTCALHGGNLRIGRSPAGGARVVLGVPTRPDP